VIEVVVEVGTKRVFASAVEWPGWCRAARTEEGALEALDAYLPRYAAVLSRAGLPGPTAASSFDVLERLAGTATTDFGAPGVEACAEREPITASAARRRAGLVAACWPYLGAVAAGAPATLRKGPRGGGRDRDAIVVHVEDAEQAYARRIGIRHREMLATPDATRAAIAARLGEASDGSALVERGWTARYAARRIAWHVLDHAFEIEDRSTPAT